MNRIESPTLQMPGYCYQVKELVFWIEPGKAGFDELAPAVGQVGQELF